MRQLLLPRPRPQRYLAGQRGCQWDWWHGLITRGRIRRVDCGMGKVMERGGVKLFLGHSNRLLYWLQRDPFPCAKRVLTK